MSDDVRVGDASLLGRAGAAAADGDVAMVVELASRACTADLDDAARVCWALLLCEVGEPEQAAAIAAQVVEVEERERLLAITSENIETPEPDWAEEDDDASELVPVEGGPTDRDLVDRFLRFFGGRRDLYARQWYDERRRRSGYHPVREPLTEKVVREHLAGRVTVGQYLLWPDATVSFAVIDLDLSSSALDAMRACRGQEACPLDHDGLRAYARRLGDAALGLGLATFAEDSGSKGLHLWLFFEPRRPARAARGVLSQVVLAAGPQPPDVSIELFPKQELPGRKGLSSLVKLPLGVHQATLRSCPLLDVAFAPIGDQRAALAALRPADPVLVDAVIARRVLPLPVGCGLTAGGGAPLPALPSSPTARTLAEALRGVPAGLSEREACERMLAGCAVLAAIVARAYERHALTADEARAVIYTLGLVGPRGTLATEVLAAAGASHKELERVRRGLPSPAGCAKLRRLGAPATCEGCTAARGALPYPTPVAFAVGDVAGAPPGHAPFAPWLEDTTELAPTAVEVLGDALGRIESRLERLEETISQNTGSGDKSDGR